MTSLKPCPFYCSTQLEPLCTQQNLVCVGHLICGTYAAYLDGEIDSNGDPISTQSQDTDEE